VLGWTRRTRRISRVRFSIAFLDLLKLVVADMPVQGVLFEARGWCWVVLG